MFCGEEDALENSLNRQIPKIIEGKYESDYDIVYIDSIIKKKLKYEKIYKVKKLESKIIEYENKLKNSRNDYITQIQIIDDINKIKNNINYILTGEKIEKYISNTKDLLIEYSKLKSNHTRIEFGKEYNNDIFNDEIKIKRIVVIEKYLDIAKEYHKISVYNIANLNKMNCPNCGIILEFDDTYDDESKNCNNCYASFEVVTYKKTERDSERITSSTVEDESLENFIKIFYKKQGLKYKKNDCNDHEIIEDICKEIEEYCKITPNTVKPEDIRKRPFDSLGRRQGTNIKMLEMLLAKINRNNFYDDADLIANKLWGNKLPNWMHLYDDVIYIYIETHKIFKLIPPEIRERTSNLPTQWVLFKILQLLNEDVVEEQFKIVENRKSRNLQKKLWKIMTTEANKVHSKIYYIE